MLGTGIIKYRYSRRRVSKSARLPASVAPPVSILRPLKGVDCNLFENLASSFRQDYPRFEIIFSVASSKDPAIEVVQKLKAMYPHVDAKLIVGDREVGVNPKVNNLMRSYESAKYDIVWILDSNVYVDSGCLGRSVDEITKPNVGLVHHLVCGVRPNSFGSRLELLFLNTAHAKMYIAINKVGVASCIVGKSNLFRRSDLDKVGSLQAFGKYMSEDNVIGQALWNLGLKHRMTSDLAYQPLGQISILDYFARRARWGRIRKYVVPVATLIEPFTESIVCGAAAAYGFNVLFGISPLHFLAAHMCFWLACDLTICTTVNPEAVWDNFGAYLLAWVIREVSAFHLYLYAVSGSTVDWRGNLFRLRYDMTVEPVSGGGTGVVAADGRAPVREDKSTAASSSKENPVVVKTSRIEKVTASGSSSYATAGGTRDILCSKGSPNEAHHRTIVS
ncbi:hypothetical protein HK102_005661 [Quaeritorhiza haematococci]|nr:hypothetical protein HK102_005661 [Quaeritorhiza haematococci]